MKERCVNPHLSFAFYIFVSLYAKIRKVLQRATRKGIFSFAFINTILGDMNQYGENLMLSYFLTYLTLTLLFSAMSFITGIIISHRSSGPLYAFEQYLENLMKGRDRKLVLRETDHYKHLEKVADKLRVHFVSKKDE